MAFKHLDFHFDTGKKQHVSEPFGVWPLKYRILVKDKHDTDGDDEWRITIERRTPLGTNTHTKVARFTLNATGEDFTDRIST